MKREPLDEGYRWLLQAEKDLSDANYLYKGKRFNTCCFLCQQAAEKALKAFLFARGAEHVYSHSVAELCQQASDLEKKISSLKATASYLDVYYIPTRYPNGLPGGIPADAFNNAEARKALDIAAKVLSLISKELKENLQNNDRP